MFNIYLFSSSKILFYFESYLETSSCWLLTYFFRSFISCSLYFYYYWSFLYYLFILLKISVNLFIVFILTIFNSIYLLYLLHMFINVMIFLKQANRRYPPLITYIYQVSFPLSKNLQVWGFFKLFLIPFLNCYIMVLFLSMEKVFCWVFLFFPWFLIFFCQFIIFILPLYHHFISFPSILIIIFIIGYRAMGH